MKKRKNIQRSAPTHEPAKVPNSSLFKHFERNFAVLRARFPAIADAIQNAPIPRIETSPHGEAGTLVIDGIHLASAMDPASEARVQAATIPEDAPAAWIFGVGNGALIERLLTRSALRQLNVIPIASRSLLACMRASPLPWLADLRVQLLDNGAIQPTALPTPRAVSPACLRLAEPHPLRDELLLDLSSDHAQAYQDAMRAMRAENATQHRARFPHAQDVATLFGTRPASHATVAAAGPTLSDSFESLRKNRASTILIAVTTALAPLEKAGIVPDFAVAIDPQPWLSSHFETLAHRDRLRDVPFVHAVDLDPGALALWPGPLVATHLLGDSFHATLRPDRPLGALFSSGTVVHTAVDLAVRLGSTRVHLLGADFAFPSGASHVAGAAFEKSVTGPQYTIRDGEGREIPTTIQFLGYLRDLERYIERHPEVRFSRGSPRGAAIAGTTLSRSEP